MPIVELLAEPNPGICTPGDEGIPHGALGQLMCGDWHTDLWHTLTQHWPLATALAVVLLVVRLGWVLVRRHRWSVHAAGARWLEITPPVSATPATTVHLWRLLATLLPAPQWRRMTPARLVWEVVADPDGMRCGLWVPPGINPTAVTRVVQRAWPGARLTHTHPPAMGQQVVAGHRLMVNQPEWLPLTDDPHPASSHRNGTQPAPEDDRLRAIYDGLAAAGRTGGALLQVHISRAPRSRVAGLRRATVDPQRARRNGRTRALGAVLAAVTSLVRGLLDLLTPGSSSRNAPRRATDPYASQLTALARVKYGTPPHLLASVHAAATGPTKAAAQAAAADISSGYGLLSAHLTRRRLPRPQRLLHQRWTPAPAMTLVTVTEAAALAGLPAEPAAYGLPQAASRRRSAGRDTWTTPDPATSRRTDRERTEAPDTAGDDIPEPTPWSVP